MILIWSRLPKETSKRNIGAGDEVCITHKD